jgi:hypothetical protein
VIDVRGYNRNDEIFRVMGTEEGNEVCSQLGGRSKVYI